MKEPMLTQRIWRIVRLAGALVLAVCLSLTAACGPKESAPPAAADKQTLPGDESAKGTVVLRVGDTQYFGQDFKTYLHKIMGDSKDVLTPEAQSRLFDRFVDDKLLLDAARRQGIYLTDEEKSRYKAKVEEQTLSDKGQALTPQDLEGLNEKLLIEKYTFTLVQSISVPDQEVHAYYISHKSDFLQAERVKVSQIMVKTEEKAIDVLARVKSLPEDGFRQLAQKESIGPEAAKSGEMGVFAPGQLPYEIEKVVFALKEGETSKIVESLYGYHIFRLDKRFDPLLISEQQAAPGILSKLLDAKINQAVEAHLEELRRTLNWSASPENLAFTYQRNLI